jgi:aminopeptidase
VDERLEAFAGLVIGTGVGLRPGQELLIDAQIGHEPFVRALTEQAYAAGARYVDVQYLDRWVKRAFVAGAPDDVLTWTPPWTLTRMERAVELGSAIVGVFSDSGADVFAGLDEKRLGRARPDELDELWMRAVLDRRVAWAVVGYPTERWAREVFGAPDLDRLWTVFSQALRLDQADPAAAWRERLQALETRAAALSARGFRALRYRGPGTELEVGLIDGARWLGGGGRTADGHRHAPNLPTEEVFTSPHRERANGVVRASMPFSLYGTMIEGLELRLAGGEIVEAKASAGETVVCTVLSTDGGARYLGELALVDDGSRVAHTGVLFRNTLFDENAASHIAWGSGFPEVLGDPPPTDHEEHGVNDSRTHVDFMVGSDELEISGVEPGGAVVPILSGGAWQLPD